MPRRESPARSRDAHTTQGSTLPPELTAEQEERLSADDREGAPAPDAEAGTAKQHAVYQVSLAYNKMLSLPGMFAQGGRPWWTPIKVPNSDITVVLVRLPPQGAPSPRLA